MRKEMTVLGISPGTRSMGLAVIADAELIDWRVKSFRAKWSKKKLRYILRSMEDIFDRYPGCRVAIKVPDVFPKAKEYVQLIGSLNILMQCKHIKARYYTLSELKSLCTNEPIATKRTLTDFLITAYPELEHLQYVKDGSGYYEKLFEAVATAHLRAAK